MDDISVDARKAFASSPLVEPQYGMNTAEDGSGCVFATRDRAHRTREDSDKITDRGFMDFVPAAVVGTEEGPPYGEVISVCGECVDTAGCTATSDEAVEEE